MKTQTAKKGFTLIEVLVVVGIIGLLASVLLVALGPASARGRDTRRVADLGSIQSALEIHFARHGRYPTALAHLTAGIAGAPGVARTLPRDPSPAQGYGYCTNALGNAYVLAANLEDPNNPLLRQHATNIFAGICAPAVVPAGVCSSVTSPTRVYCVTL